MSQENRELREKIREFESKISPKRPNIKLHINTPTIDYKYNSCEKLALPKELGINDIEAHLMKYVSEDELKKYNNNIPSQSEIDSYNDARERFYKIENYSVPLVIEVSNEGTVKANNLYIDIEFPDEIFVYEKDTEFDEPKNPIPFSPIARAKSRYKTDLQERQNRNSPSAMLPNHDINGSEFAHSTWRVPKIRHPNQSWWTKLDGGQLTIQVDSLIHTRYRSFEDEYMIVPLKAGKYDIKIQVICEELENQEIQIFEMDIQESDA